MIGFVNEWTWAIDIAIWFLMLVSETTTTIFELAEVWRTCSSSLWIYADLLSLLFWLEEWKEKWLEKISINLEPGEILLLRELKERNILLSLLLECHIQVHLSGNNVPAVKPSPNHTSLSSTVATFLTTRLMAVLQPSRYSVFHGGDTPIQLGFLWQSYSCQCLNTETSARGNRCFTTETLSISYTISYI